MGSIIIIHVTVERRLQSSEEMKNTVSLSLNQNKVSSLKEPDDSVRVEEEDFA